jgi:hypothetical protein
MKYSEKIENITSKVDGIKTKNFYLTQNLIQDDCSCEDCEFYQNEFIKLSLDIYKKLDRCGVDLRKNINDEPTGVWVIREEKKIVHCEPVYRLFGDFQDIEEDTFETTENNYKITIQLHKNDKSYVTLYLTIDNIE